MVQLTGISQLQCRFVNNKLRPISNGAVLITLTGSWANRQTTLKELGGDGGRGLQGTCLLVQMQCGGISSDS